MPDSSEMAQALREIADVIERDPDVRMTADIEISVPGKLTRRLLDEMAKRPWAAQGVPGETCRLAVHLIHGGPHGR